MLIGSLVELYAGLHSYLRFSLLEKLFWKAGSTPPRYLAIYQASQAFFLNAISTPPRYLVDRSRKLLHPQHLLDRSSFCSESDSLLLDSFLDTSAIEDQILNTYLDTSRYLHLSRFTSCLYKASVRSGFHFSSISLSILLCFSPQNTLILLQLCSSRILQAFSSFSLLGKLLILSYSCIWWFKT